MDSKTNLLDDKGNPVTAVDKNGHVGFVQQNGGILTPGWKKPGPGRPPSITRKRGREGFAAFVERIASLAEKEDLPVKEQVQCGEFLGKYFQGKAEGVLIDDDTMFLVLEDTLAELVDEGQIKPSDALVVLGRFADKVPKDV